MRILIMSASTGGGHMRTSKAMESYVKQYHPHDEVRIVDALEHAGHLYNKTVSDGYEFMAKNTPKLYGTFYNTANKDTALSNMAEKFNKSLSKKLLPVILEFLPDVIIVVHAFAAEMVSVLRTKYNMRIPVICIITDFAPHKMYIQPGIDRFVVANDDMVESLYSLGIPKERIHALGIPIDMSFYDKYDKKELKKEMGLNPEIQTILLMAGSFGVTDILRIYQKIAEIDYDFQIIVITGKNPKLYDAFDRMLSTQELPDRPNEEKTEVADEPVVEEAAYTGKKTLSAELSETLKDGAESIKETWKDSTNLIKESIKDSFFENSLVQKLYKGSFDSGKSKPTKLLYFVDDINKQMTVADLIITKPGGLTVSEAIAMNLPMAIFKAYPGQEEDNAEFLERKNVAIRLPKSENCGYVIAHLLNNPHILDEMKECCSKLYKDKSVEKVYALAKQLTGKEEKEQ